MHSVMRFIPLLVRLAETLFGAGRGADKKAFVLDLVELGLEMLDAAKVRETASDEVKNAVRDVASKTIDATVAVYNATGVFKKALDGRDEQNDTTASGGQ